MESNWTLSILNADRYHRFETLLNTRKLNLFEMIELQKSNIPILIVQRLNERGIREVLFSPGTFNMLSSILPELELMDTVEVNNTELTSHLLKSDFRFLYGSKSFFEEIVQRS